MKKTSLRNIESLSKQGWDIEGKDRTRITDLKNTESLTKAIESVNRSIDSMTSLGKELEKNHNSLKTMMNSSGSALADTFQKCTDRIVDAMGRKKTFDLDVKKRNENGFIQRVLIKEI